MIQQRRRIKYILLTPVFIIASVLLSFSNVELASAAPLTWTGDGDGTTFSDGDNWNTDAAPQDGDTLTFPVGILTANTILENDIVGLSLTGITVSGSSPSNFSYEIEGENLAMTGDITNGTSSRLLLDLPVQAMDDFDISGLVIIAGSDGILNLESHTVTYSISDQCMYINKLNGTGHLVLNGNSSIALGPGNANFHGDISLSDGFLIPNYSSSLNDGTVTVTGDGGVLLYSDQDSTWNANFNLGGNGWIAAQHESTNGCSGGSSPEVYTATLTGAVTLTSDFLYYGHDNMVITGSYTNNGHNFTVKPGAIGTLTTPDGTEEAPTITTDLNGDQPDTDVSVVSKETAILNGSRRNISIFQGGILMGTGTASNIYNSGIVNPGNSPGTLTVLETYSGSGVYRAELLNKDTYDKLVVGAEYAGGFNAVSLNIGATLETVLYDGWNITQGDQFTVLDNQSDTAISGTFDGLAEGAQFTVQDGTASITFNITYEGGDGNDIVITALNTGSDPTPPNTGALQLITGNPLLVAGLGIITAGLLALIAFRRRVTH